MPLDTSIKKVLVIGSGPIVIGQAAEFDYAGAQACRVLKEAGLDVVLPASLQKELGAWFEKKAAAVMGEGVSVSFTRQIAGGFRIGPRDGGYMISFAEGDFESILTEYLRPATRKLLFG